MECVIENSNFGNIFAENFHTSIDTLNVSGVVKGSKVAKAFDAIDNFVCDECAFFVDSTTLNNSVTDCADFAQIIDNFCFT